MTLPPRVTPPAPEQVATDVARALAEDLGSGDVTAALLPDADAVAQLLCKQDCIIAGGPWFDACHRSLDRAVRITWHCKEGDRVQAGMVLATVEGRSRALVSAERTSLNFMQTLSAVATTTAAYVDAVRDARAPAPDPQILDTRKTLPGLRSAQKYAVRVGGGVNHRTGLFDAVMLKENHIRTTGSLVGAIQAARAAQPSLPLIVEVETLTQLREALDAGCTRILIDDFSQDDRREAVRIAQAAPYHGRIPLEVSGSVDLTTVRAIAADGVDCISVGGLTKHIRAIDLSLKFSSSAHPS